MLNVSETEVSNVMQLTLDFNIRQGSARGVDDEKTEVLCATFEDLQVRIRAYPKKLALACEGRVEFYGLAAPE